MTNYRKPANEQYLMQILDKFVLKHLRPKKVQFPKKSNILFLGRCQNHLKSGLFYKNHQSKMMQSLKINYQSS